MRDIVTFYTLGIYPEQSSINWLVGQVYLHGDTAEQDKFLVLSQCVTFQTSSIAAHIRLAISANRFELDDRVCPDSNDRELSVREPYM